MVELSSLGVKKSPQQVNFIVAAVDNLQQLLQRVFLVVVVLAALVVVFWLATGSYLAYRTSERDKLITQVNQVVASLEATRDFERRFIVTRDKLELYGEININEKMVDLFPRLSALVPYGVRLQSMSIAPQTVIITALSNDLNSLTLFYNNLQTADGSLLDDGQRFKLKDLTYRDVSKDSSNQIAASDGYVMSFTFNYLIEPVSAAQQQASAPKVGAATPLEASASSTSAQN